MEPHWGMKGIFWLLRRRLSLLPTVKMIYCIVRDLDYLGQTRSTPGEGTPSMLGDMDVPPFWPPFLTLWGLNTIFLGYLFSSTNSKAIFWGTKTTIFFTKIDLFGPKFNFFLDLFESNFQRPAAHPHQFSGWVPPPPPPPPPPGVNTIAADALAPVVPRSSTVMVSISRSSASIWKECIHWCHFTMEEPYKMQISIHIYSKQFQMSRVKLGPGSMPFGMHMLSHLTYICVWIMSFWRE